MISLCYCGASAEKSGVGTVAPEAGNLLTGGNRRDKTTIIVAHRISAVMACDEILVLDDSTIRERGTHEELLERRGLYFDIYNSQYKDRIHENDELGA